MPNKIKYLKRNICEEKEYHFGILFLVVGNLRKKYFWNVNLRKTQSYNCLKRRIKQGFT